MYRDNIGIGDKYSFGVEIEFGIAKLLEIYPKLLASFVPVTYSYHHKIQNPSYEKWYLDIDPTVTLSVHSELFGGELSSRVFSDSLEDWKEIQKVCMVLKKSGAVSDSFCSTHITVDVSEYLDNPAFFEVFSKILTVYETDMSLFYMGDKYFVRRTKDKYASSMKSRLLNQLSNVSFRSDLFLEMLISITNCFQIHDGVSFYKLLDRGLIEFRYPNGSLNEETIQNDVNFTLKILKAIEEGRFSLSQLDSFIEEDQEDPFQKLRILHNLETPDRFLEFLDIISDSNEDYHNFEKQYEKVLSSRK